MREQYRQELIEGMKELSKNGFRCFIHKKDPSFLFGFVITPNDNVIYIQRDSYEFRGWSTSLNYVPSRENGSGCQCFEEPFQDITTDIILEAEKEGLRFARKLKAKLYNNSEEYLKNMWHPEDYEEVI